MRSFHFIFKPSFLVTRGVISRSGSTRRCHISKNVFDENKAKFIRRMEHLSSRQEVLNKNATMAAVLIPFCVVDGKPSVLFTRRSHNIVRNKGDVCFPGGIMNETDRNIVDTALRETSEEIGLPPSDVNIWVNLKPIIGTNDAAINIVPVFGFIEKLNISKLVIDHNEVASVFSVSLEQLCDPTHQAYTKFNTGIVMPLFCKDTYKIWGFTAILLDYCLSNLLPDFYSLRYRPAQRRKRDHC